MLEFNGKSTILYLENIMVRNITITTVCRTFSTPMLFKKCSVWKLDPKKLITHRFKLEEIIQAYNTFDMLQEEKALKVILTN